MRRLLDHYRRISLCGRLSALGLGLLAASWIVPFDKPLSLAGFLQMAIDDSLALYPAAINLTLTQQQKLGASDAAQGDVFGESVAISGNTAVVGARADDGAAGFSQGSAYVFVRNGVSWSQQQKLQPSDADAFDEFGFSVAVSGDTAVVGARFDNGTAGSDQGSAYVFVRNGATWSQQQKLVATDAAAGDQFGWSVAINGDTIVIGAVGDDGAAGFSQGSAYVFVRNGTSWSQQQKLEANDAAAFDQFGWSVAISGEMIVAGASGDDEAAGSNQGSVHVFVRSGGSWSLQQKLVPGDAAAGDVFGNSVAISGETMVAGAAGDNGAAGPDQGSAYVFVRSGTSWSLQQKLEASDAQQTDLFGQAVSISGESLIVGATGDDGTAGFDQGSGHVFARSGVSWSLQQKIEANDASEGDSFGGSVAMSEGAAIVGAPEDTGQAGAAQGSAYVFTLVAANAPPVARCRSVAVAAGPSCTASASINDGSFDPEGQALTLTQSPTGPYPLGPTIVTQSVVDSQGATSSCMATITVVSSASPTLTLKPSLSLWPPNHKVVTITTTQMVESVSRACDSLSVDDVVIEQVASDEPANPRGNSGSADIAIAAGCKAVHLVAERDESKNGRVYSILLRVRDTGNTSRAVFQVTVPPNQNAPAVRDATAFAVTSNCP